MRIQTKGGVFKRNRVITYANRILRIVRTTAGTPTADQCNLFFSKTLTSPGADYTTGFNYTVNGTPRAIIADGNVPSAIAHQLASNMLAGDVVKASYDATLGDIIDVASGNALRSFTDYTLVNVL